MNKPVYHTTWKLCIKNGRLDMTWRLDDGTIPHIESFNWTKEQWDNFVAAGNAQWATPNNLPSNVIPFKRKQ